MTKVSFHDHFHDARLRRPAPGEALAVYRATADFCAGPEKRAMIAMLRTRGRAGEAARVMRDDLNAEGRDSLRVPRMMAEDLAAGVPDDEVDRRPYRYTFEMHFYARPEHVPAGDPHWSVVPLAHV